MRRRIRFLRKAITTMLPWPAKHERQAAIEAAAREKDRARKGAAEAGVIERQIRQIARQNHWAELIADDIIRGHRKANRETH